MIVYRKELSINDFCNALSNSIRAEDAVPKNEIIKSLSHLWVSTLADPHSLMMTEIEELGVVNNEHSSVLSSIFQACQHQCRAISGKSGSEDTVILTLNIY